MVKAQAGSVSSASVEKTLDRMAPWAVLGVLVIDHGIDEGNGGAFPIGVEGGVVGDVPGARARSVLGVVVCRFRPSR